MTKIPGLKVGNFFVSFLFLSENDLNNLKEKLNAKNIYLNCDDSSINFIISTVYPIKNLTFQVDWKEKVFGISYKTK